jgi:hypothetical protein
VALPEGIGADPNPLVAVPNPGPILFLNVDVGGQSLVGIQLSRPPGSPGSQGIQVVVANRLQYPVGSRRLIATIIYRSPLDYQTIFHNVVTRPTFHLYLHG